VPLLPQAGTPAETEPDPARSHTVPTPCDAERALTPTADQLNEAISGAIAIAPQLIDDAAWLWVDAYWPPGKDRERPTRVSLRRNESDSPDHVPGERLALGVGNDAARAAYARAAQHVADAHRLAARAAAHYSGRKPPVGERRPPQGPEMAVMVDSIRRRLRDLLDAGIGDLHVDRPRLDAHAAAVALVAAHAVLQGVLRDDGGSGQEPLSRRCDDCGKVCEDQKRRKCWQCVQRRARGKKPVRRWAEAHAAKARRVARGEDHGESPLPRPSLGEGVI
jgi:hypothetical protein